jgi:hypothetical protein
MATGRLEGFEHARQVMGVIPQGGDRVEVGALVVGDVGGVVAKQVPASFRDECEELLVAERAAIYRPANLDRHGHAPLPELFSVFVGAAPKDGRNHMAGGG